MIIFFQKQSSSCNNCISVLGSKELLSHNNACKLPFFCNFITAIMGFYVSKHSNVIIWIFFVSFNCIMYLKMALTMAYTNLAQELLDLSLHRCTIHFWSSCLCHRTSQDLCIDHLKLLIMDDEWMQDLEHKK